MEVNKEQARKRRARKLRAITARKGDTHRLSVYRSLRHIYAQVFSLDGSKTLVCASSVEKNAVGDLSGKNKSQVAAAVGKLLGERALKAEIKKVVFDRSGYPYLGRVLSLANGARGSGLKF